MCWQAWAISQREAMTKSLLGLEEFDKQHKSGGKKTDLHECHRADLEGRVKLLKDLDEAKEDPGPMLVCVVWYDGAAWRAAVDSSEIYDGMFDGLYDGVHDGKIAGEPAILPGGKLASCPALTNFKAERQFATLSPYDACNFAVNIYDDGNVLSLVTDSSPHGTHVAGITAAYHPEVRILFH